MSFIVFPEDTQSYNEHGGKGKSLAIMQQAGLPVPPWCVVLPEAFYSSLSASQYAEMKTIVDSADAKTIIAGMIPNSDMIAELELALARLCPNGELIAVRSSALDEDGVQHSFAGQLDSFLFVEPVKAIEKISAVWQSAFSERIIAYAHENGLSPMPSAPAVILQRMLNADVAGVAFSADPVNGYRGRVVISAVYGLGSSLVSGESDADTVMVDRENNIVDYSVAAKHTAHRAAPEYPEGIRPEPVPAELVNAPALTSEQVLAISSLARQAEQVFGRPQDIEWAIENHTVYLVQSRPITSIASLADPDGVLNLWDNSNIAESYGGVTTPLTFSFARNAYEHVYRQFCSLMGVPESVIAAHDATYRRMLGLIRGRIFYNLLSWYRILALLPGFKANRRFMEQMMGVKEGLPEDLMLQINKANWGDRLLDGVHVLQTCVKLVINHITMTRSITKFYKRLNDALAPLPIPLELMRADELADHYRELERKLLTRWDAPLVNDFFAMIFYGLLRRCTEKWCADTQGTLQNDLISGQGGIISAEPARRICEMAKMAVDYPTLVDALCNAPVHIVLEQIGKHPEFDKAYLEYLEIFGDRCLEELKLESITLHDDPLLLVRSIGQIAANYHDTSGEPVAENLRELAENRIKNATRRQPFRRAMLGTILRNARNHVRDRENLRFERTRVFGRVRRVFVELGKRLVAADLLDDYRDVFYLEANEIIGVVDGTASCTNLKGLTSLRKAEYARYKDLPAPDDRFETRGIVHQGNSFRASTASATGGDAEQRKGIGCCPGIVKGKVRVVTDPRNAVLESGCILVAERTDPGWIMLFPSAIGVLVERGSLLSHSAIVAREMRIPTVVSIPGITRWLKDGDMVEFDGSTGIVRLITETPEVNDAQ